MTLVLVQASVKGTTMQAITSLLPPAPHENFSVDCRLDTGCSLHVIQAVMLEFSV